MSLVDTRSPELAYSSKRNIVFPGSAAQATAAEALAAIREVDGATLSQDTTSRTGSQVTKTKHIAR